MNFLVEDLENLKQRLENIHLLPKPLEDVLLFLRASEYQLIQLMIENALWQPPVAPAAPIQPPPAARGDLHCSLFPYWVNHPPQVILNFLSGDDPIKRALKFLWNAVALRLPSQISVANYDGLVACARGAGLVAPNGIVYGERQYEQLDIRWIWAWINYLITHHILHPVAFGATPASPIALTGAAAGEVRIALVGDWGTGDAVASAVMSQITELKPDYIVHLGDVYYAGTGGVYWPLHEERSNLLGYWPPAYAGRSFTLNSNHEMYSGGDGYFEALNAPGSPFTTQRGASFFALQFAGWTILGLDSAYYSTSPMIMDGSIGGAAGAQYQWIQNLGLPPEKVIVLTHHNGLSDDGAVKQPLWAEINAALGGDPFAWYWGHEHLGVVYKAPAGSRTLGRCLGHGALPFGDASELHGAPAVEWYAHTPQPSSKLAYNGSALLTLKSAAGQLASIDEAFYDLESPAPKWTKSLYP
ncbi:MAG: metallophosphoesterase family protein [Terriglobia bacterium]